MLELTLVPDPELELEGFVVDLQIIADRHPGDGKIRTDILIDGKRVLHYKLARERYLDLKSPSFVLPPGFDIPSEWLGDRPNYWSSLFREVIPTEQRLLGERALHAGYRSFRIRTSELVERYLDAPEEFVAGSGRYIIRRKWDGEYRDGTLMLSPDLELLPDLDPSTK